MLTKGTHYNYSRHVSGFDWSDEKNAYLEQTRNVSFEDVVVNIDLGNVLDVIAHPNREKYPGQRIMVLEMYDYVWLVPYTKTGGTRFLKTIIPSRKATRENLR